MNRPFAGLILCTLASLLGCLCWPGEDRKVADKRWLDFHQDQLKRTYHMYDEAARRLGRPPASADDLVAHSEEDEGTIRYIRGGNITVQWATDPTRHCPQGAGRTLLIHDIDVRKADNTTLHDVILADGTFRTVNDEEFANLPRPQK